MHKLRNWIFYCCIVTPLIFLVLTWLAGLWSIAFRSDGRWDGSYNTMGKLQQAPSEHPIPRVLWQTYKQLELPSMAAEAQKTWKKLNHQVPIKMHDDRMGRNFINSSFGPQVMKMYTSFPLGVMRADFWRYAILYTDGGIYSDVDTECLNPIKAWLPDTLQSKALDDLPLASLYRKELTWRSCQMVIGMEGDSHFCQWTFASRPGHPLLKHTIDLVIKRAMKGIDLNMDGFVHYYTGPALWTAAIASFLGFPETTQAVEVFNKTYNDPLVFNRTVRELGVCLMPPDFFGGKQSQNLFGSWRFVSDEGWVSWIEDQDHRVLDHKVVTGQLRRIPEAKPKKLVVGAGKMAQQGGVLQKTTKAMDGASILHRVHADGSHTVSRMDDTGTIKIHQVSPDGAFVKTTEHSVAEKQ